jgi:hypothetical protein
MAYASPSSFSHQPTVGQRRGMLHSDLHSGVGEPLVRLIWMTEFMTRKPVLRLSDCQERWGVSLRTFRRDLARLRDAGFIIDPAAETCTADPAVRTIGWHAAG